MQRRELDRDPRIVADVTALRRRRDGGDGARIGQMIAPRIGFGPGSLAQHVVAVAVALGLQLGRARHRALDGLAQHELAPHLLHGAGHGLADHRLAQPPHEAAQMARHARLAVVEHLARQHQRPGRGIDKARGRPPQMPVPVRGRDLVLDQRIHRLGIRHPQQRLGQAHERDPLVGREAVFRKEALHQPGPRSLTDAADEIRPAVHDARTGGRVEIGLGDQARHEARLVESVGRGGMDSGGEHGRTLLFRLDYRAIGSRSSRLSSRSSRYG